MLTRIRQFFRRLRVRLFGLTKNEQALASHTNLTKLNLMFDQSSPFFDYIKDIERHRKAQRIQDQIEWNEREKELRN